MDNSGFKVKDFLGVFYREGSHLLVSDEFEGVRNVDHELASYGQQEVSVFAHHRPVEPVSNVRWGGGCCMLEASGFCFFGHHDDPRRAFSFKGVGTLVQRDQDWFLEQEPGEYIDCGLRFLIGHRSQIIVTTIPNMDALDKQVKEITSESLEGQSIQELKEKIERTKSLLVEINKLKDNL